MSNAGSQILMTEFFPVLTEALPTLYSYQIDANGGDRSTIGGKLAYRLKRTFPGHWAWADGRIVTDAPQEQSEVMEVVKTLWAEQPDIFRGLRSVSQDVAWSPTPRAISEFVARGLLSDCESDIRAILNAEKQDLGNAYVERVHDIKPWVVQSEPAVSVSISSRLLHKQDLAGYIAQKGADDLEGLQVADKTSTLKGTIVRVVGPLSGERERLLTSTQRDEMHEIIANAPDHELVVSVSVGYGTPYDYVVSVLRIVMRSEYFGRFQVNSRKALSALRIDPTRRAKIIGEVSQIVQARYVGRAYNSQTTPELFKSTRYSGQVLVGNNQTVAFDDNILSHLQKHGLYKIADSFRGSAPIRVGFVNALGRVSFDSFWDQIETKLRALGFNVQKVGSAAVEGSTRFEFERAINELRETNPDILLGFFPDNFDDEDDDESAYYHFKSLTVGQGIPSQVIEQSTLSSTYAIGNIIMGIIGKTGNIPFILAEPLDFADVIVGIDIARERKKRLRGSLNATAVTRIYLSNGEFLQYAIHDAPLEGETVPAGVLQSLFPSSEFAGKRVVIHRDGYFRGDEKRVLKAWAAEIGATFHLVQVIKSGAPRVYAYQDHKFIQPQKGCAFLLNENEAVLISSLPPFQNATPQPLRITAEHPFTIDQALRSVLAMTNLHYGSLKAPRLPVTIHYSDKIAYLVLKGIKPRNLTGTLPYWL